MLIEAVKIHSVVAAAKALDAFRNYTNFLR